MGRVGPHKWSQLSPAQPSPGRLQEGGQPEPLPVSTGPRDRDSQACDPHLSACQYHPGAEVSQMRTSGLHCPAPKFLATRDQGQA